MKKFLVTLLLICVAAGAMAVPARRVTRTFNYNGKEIRLTLTGDENRHYWLDGDGNAYTIDDTGNATPFNLNQANNRSQTRRQAPKVKEQAHRRVGANGNAYVGERRGLVILVNFKDKQFTCTKTPQATYQQVMAGINYSGNGQYGSVRDYFRAQSYGKFDYVLDVAGPVTLSQNMSYYGANNDEGDDLRPGEMVEEACRLANTDVDFSRYDWDGDGEVEQIYIIYAGYGEAQGASKNTIWPHAWSIEDATGKTLRLDGVKVDQYACSSELMGTTGSKMDGIGTICHEFSHCFGLPDFYDTEYNTDFAMGEWSVMDYGSYNNNGYCPASYTAYERWFCGWLEPEVLDRPTDVAALENIDTSGQCYVIYNQANADEYYMLQNVQKTGWNSYAGGHGMLVLHVDYDYDEWYNNTPNNTASHLRMSPICADNKANSNSRGGDPYPGTSGNTGLTDTSTPAAMLFNRNKDGRRFMGRPIEDIKENNGVVSFTFDGGIKIDAPTGVAAQTTGKGSFRLSWNAVQDAASYTVEYGAWDGSASPVETTYLDILFVFDVQNDGSQDIGSSLDTALGVPGFTGSKLYKSPNGLKMGSSKANGYIISPELDFEADEVCFYAIASPYNGKNGVMTVSTIDRAGNVVAKSKEVTISDELQDIELTLDTKDADKIRIDANGRIYLGGFEVKALGTNPYGDPVTLSGIVGTQTTIAHQLTAAECYVRVRAVDGKGKPSTWSETIVFKLDANETAIDRPAAATDSETYMLDGRRATATGSAAGLYIVRARGKAAKIFKK